MQKNPVFYVYAPDYTELSSGRKALHIICDKLNHLGYESYITSQIVSNHLWTPRLTNQIMEGHKKANRIRVAIYPEIEMGNPLQCENVIRWLLNKPNFFRLNWFGQFDESEFIVHHAEEFRPPWVKSSLQYIGTIDRSIFNTNDTSNNRDGIIIYHNRIKGEEIYPNWIKNIYHISINEPKSPLQCSELYKKASALVTYERAASHVEAALCGCPTIFREHKNFNPESVFSSYWKISSFKEFDSKINHLNRGNGQILEKIYDDEVIADSLRFEILIEKVVGHFRKFRDRLSDQIPSIQISQIEQALLIKDYANAAKVLAILLKKPNLSNNELFIYYKFCKLTGDDNRKALLNELINKLEGQNSNDFLGNLISQLRKE